MRFVNGNSIDICRQLESWYERSTGQYLLAQEQALVEAHLQQIFGYHQLQLGVTRHQQIALQSPLGHKIYAASQGGGQTGLRTEIDNLPFADDSIDVVILHHALEFVSDPHGLLREAHRVVAPQGHLIVLGFNPFSLPGLGLQLRKLWLSSPWRDARPMGAWRLRDWLNLLGSEVQSVRHCLSVPPVGGQRLTAITQACEKFATRHNWPVGGVYVMHARKQVASLTPRRMGWQKSMGNKLIDLTVPKPVPSPREGDVAA